MTDARAVARLLGSRITVDNTDFSVMVDERDARFVYIPLAREITEEATSAPSSRFIVGLAGPPGAGKSVTAAILAHAIEIIEPRLNVRVVPLDGFHLSNRALERRTTELADGSRVSLRSIKGHQRTFDVERVVEAVQQLRNGDIVSLPVYSRVTHDPIENALRIDEQCRVVIVEGNYLYLKEGLWSELHTLFDMKVFVIACDEVLHRNLFERHIRGGRTPAEATEQILTVDAPNIETVRSTADVADIVISGERGTLVVETLG